MIRGVKFKRVVIGSTAPAGKLDVEGSGGVILNAGNVGIGTTLPTGLLDVAYSSGTAHALTVSNSGSVRIGTN